MTIKGLWEYKLFKRTFSAGTVLAVASAFAILFSEIIPEKYQFCGTSECFISFVQLYAFPIDVLKATAAILAIVALLHKSDETQVQISISESQNTYNNYFHHRDMVYKEITESISNSKTIKLYNFNKLYNLLFPLNRPDNFNFNAEFKNVEKVFEHFFINTFKHSPLREFENNNRALDNLGVADKLELSELIDVNFCEAFDSLGFCVEADKRRVYDEDLRKSYPDLHRLEIKRVDGIEISLALYTQIEKDLDNIIDAINRISFSNSYENKLSFFAIGKETLRVNFKITHPINNIWMHICKIKFLLVRRLFEESTR
ncbi:hypothetical protein [Shewanella xiamenensis]|uniref:hypothetical protein n=1 Tax=Shewanella xiamenensis TaxID=332186 RepID=UPI0035B98F11